MNPLPCPFCGHVGLDFSEGSTFRWLSYSCGGCGIGAETRVQTLGAGTKEEWRAQGEADAIKEWNMRAPLEGSQDARDAADKMFIAAIDLIYALEHSLSSIFQREKLRDATVAYAASKRPALSPERDQGRG